jgi:polyisoprenoid-binding protein YceI
MRQPRFCLLPFSSLVVGALVSVSGCANPADDVAPAKVSAPVTVKSAAASAPTSAATPTALSAAPKETAPSEIPKDAQTLKFAADTSKIEFIGAKVTGKHDGGFKSFQGTWNLVPAKPESSLISAQISMESLWTDTDRLTGHLRTADFFDVAKFPTTTFESTAISTGSSDPKAKDATHTVTGNITIHGVTKSIQFPAKITVTPSAATLESEFFLNRKDFGVNYAGMANDLIRDEVVIKLAIRAPRIS